MARSGGACSSGERALLIFAASVLTERVDTCAGGALTVCDGLETVESLEGDFAEFVEVARDTKRLEICKAKAREALSTGELTTTLSTGFDRGIVASGFTLPEVESGFDGLGVGVCFFLERIENFHV